jgi:ribonucleoside-diphosphate reductase alpha chain
MDVMFGCDVLAIETLKARYLLEGERDWEDVCERVAKAIATSEAEYLDRKSVV